MYNYKACHSSDLFAFIIKVKSGLTRDIIIFNYIKVLLSGGRVNRELALSQFFPQVISGFYGQNFAFRRTTLPNDREGQENFKRI